MIRYTGDSLKEMLLALENNSESLSNGKKEKCIKKWQGILMIVGLLLLNNPDIELISTIGTLLMCFGYFPIGIKALHNTL